MCVRSPMARGAKLKPWRLLVRLQSHVLRASSPTAGDACLRSKTVWVRIPPRPLCGGMAELVMRPAATRYTPSRAQVRVLLPPLLEGGTERSVTGLENRARVTPEGSIPSPSVTRREAMKGETKGRHGRPFGYPASFPSSRYGKCPRRRSVKPLSKNKVGWSDERFNSSTSHILLGRSSMVEHEVLDLGVGGSSPSAPVLYA